jgi:hypothetical protein
VVGPEFNGFLPVVNHEPKVGSERIDTISVSEPLGSGDLLALLSLVIRIRLGHLGLGFLDAKSNRPQLPKKSFGRSCSPRGATFLGRFLLDKQDQAT